MRVAESVTNGESEASRCGLAAAMFPLNSQSDAIKVPALLMYTAPPCNDTNKTSNQAKGESERARRI